MILVISGQTGISGGEIVLGNSLTVLKDEWRPIVLCPPLQEVQDFFEKQIGVRTKAVSFLTTSSFERKRWGPFGRVMKVLKIVLGLFQFFALCLELRPQKILCNTPGDAHLSLAAHLLNIPFFQYVHEDYRDRKGMLLYFQTLRKFITKFICVGSSCSSALDLAKIHANKRIVIHNGVPSQKFVDHPLSNPLQLTYIGALEERKNPLLALQCLEEASKTHPCVLNIYYHYANPATLKQVQEFIQTKRLQAQLIYQAPRAELLRKAGESDFLILASRSEGLPTVLLEAMSFGTPCFSTEVGSVRDILHPRLNGFLFSDAQDFNRQLQDILSSQLKYKDLRQNAYQTVERSFLISLAATKLNQTIQGLN